jgi:hypothetical protein
MDDAIPDAPPFTGKVTYTTPSFQMTYVTSASGLPKVMWRVQAPAGSIPARWESGSACESEQSAEAVSRTDRSSS